MLPLIKTLWIGGDLSRLEYVCLNSFLVQGHRVQLYTYGNVGNVPKGVEILDARVVLPEDKIFTYGKVTGKGKGSYAGFANYFRYKMLSTSENSYWVDADILCLKPFPPVKELIVGKEDDNFVNNAVIGVESQGHELFDYLCKYCEYPFSLNSWDSWKIIIKKIYGRTYGRSSLDYLPWGLTGPKALTGYLSKLNLKKYSSDVSSFYPISHSDWEKIFMPSDLSYKDFPNSYCIHLWNEHLRRNGIDKNAVLNEKSLYEKLISELELDLRVANNYA